MTRVAVVTGAAQGIGLETARVLAERGFALALIDLRHVGGDLGVPTLKLTGDVSNEADVKRFAERTLAEFGRVDVLVNNAGVSCIVPAEDTTTEQFRRVLDVNLLGPFVLSREFGRAMLARGAGAIVNVASVAGLAGVSDRAAYNASKHGLIGLTRTLAGEWGGRGVRVNAVCPGWVKTEMDDRDSGSGAYTAADIEGRVPMGRFASPRDIAEAIAFLADPDKSAFVNGAILSVDGGWFADASWERLRLGKR